MKLWKNLTRKIPYHLVSTERLETLMADHFYMNEYRNKWMEGLIEIKRAKDELKKSRELERITRRKLIEQNKDESK